MALGRRSGKDDSAEPDPDAQVAEVQVGDEPAVPVDHVEPVVEPVEPMEPGEFDEFEGPFDIDDFDDPKDAELARLDLGSVLIPMPEAGQLQVELTETGVPSAVWIVTPNGRFTIAAYAAPKTGGYGARWPASLRTRCAGLGQSHHQGWSVGAGGGRYRLGRSALHRSRRLPLDDRCVVNGPNETIDALNDEARTALADTVVRRDDTPLPVRTPLPVQLPEPMAEQLREAAAAQQAPGPAEAEQQPSDEPAARRSAEGSAMQQLRTTTGG